jgi:hypothetical protein
MEEVQRQSKVGAESLSERRKCETRAIGLCSQ